MKFFARKQSQRIANYALAALLVLSSITASVPFIFSETANAVSGAVYSNAGLSGWTADRTAPSGGVEQTTFDGRNVLAIGVVTPPSASSSFYRYEGVKKSIAATKTIKADLYVDSTFPSNARIGIWGEGRDASNAISSYPIIEFNKSASTNWRIFDSAGAGGWREVAVPGATTGWNTIELAINKIDSAKTDVYVNGALVGVSLGDPTENLKTIFLNNYNTGAGNYTVNWSNIQTGQYTPDTPTALKFYKGSTEVAPGTAMNVASGSKIVALKWDSVSAIDMYSVKVTYPDTSFEQHWTSSKTLWIGQTAYVTNQFGLKGDGVYTYAVKAHSATTGLWSDFSTTTSLKFDTTAPVGQLQYIAGKNVSAGKPIVNTAGSQLIVTGVAEDDQALNRVGVQLVKVGVSGGLQHVYADNNGLYGQTGSVNWTAAFNTSALNLQDGEYAINVSYVDKIGNVSKETVPFTLDNAAPEVESLKVSNVTLPTSRYFRATVNVTAAVDSSETNMKSHWFEIKGPNNYNKIVTTGLNQGGNSYSFTWDTTGLNGQYSIRYVATDQAGNRNDNPGYTNAYVRTVNLDNTAPVGQLNAIAGKDVSAGKPTVNTSGNQLVIEGVATDDQALNRIGVQLVKVGVSGGLQYVYANNNTLYGQTGTVNWAAVFNTAALNLQDGEYAINVSYVDKIGNVSNETVLFTLDNTAPVVTIDPQANTTTAQPTITGTVDDVDATLVVTFNGVDYPVTNNSGAFSFTAPAPLANGSYLFSVTATDAGLNAVTVASSTPIVVAVTPSEEEENTTDTAATGTAGTPTPATTFSAPAFTSPAAAAVLGTTTDAEDAAVEGATDEKVAAAVSSEANQGTIFGIAWFWWILIIGALATLAWFIIGAIRRRNEANS